MRILHTADWHLGKSLEQISRLPEQKEFIDDLSRIADEHQVDLVLVAGDIFDTYNPSAAAEELFYDAIERLNAGGRRAVVVIAGNHDNPERLCAASPLAYKNGIILLGYPGSDAGEYTIDSPAVRWIAGGRGWLELHLSSCDQNVVLLTLPYPSEARLEDLLSETADEALLQKAYEQRIGKILEKLSTNFREDTVNIVVSHLFMLGGKTSDSERTLQVGGALTVAAEVMPANTDYVALGHLHRPQKISGGHCPIYYAGSPLAYSFSEAGYSKAVYLVDIEPGTAAKVEPIYLNSGKPLVKWRAQEGVAEAIRWCEAGRDKDAWVDLEIVTDRVLTMEEQKLIRQLHLGIVNIRPRLLHTDSPDAVSINRETKKIDELFREYYQYRLGIEIPDEIMQVFLQIVNDEALLADEDLTEDATEAEAEVEALEACQAEDKGGVEDAPQTSGN